ACKSLFVLLTSMENTASSGAIWTSAVPETVITGSLSISCADEEKAEHSSNTIKVVNCFISKPSTFEYRYMQVRSLDGSFDDQSNLLFRLRHNHGLRFGKH